MSNPRVDRLQRASRQAARNWDIITELQRDLKALERARDRLQESLDESLEKQDLLRDQLQVALKAINEASP